MASSESSLRRRGRGSVSDSSGHARTESDGFGSFVDSSSAFPSSFDPAPAEPPEHQATSSSVAYSSPTGTRTGSTSQHIPQRSTDEDADQWAEADMVASFSPLETHFQHSKPPSTAPTSSSQPAPVVGHKPAVGRKISGRGASSEWADWDSFLATHTIPTDQSRPRNAGSSSLRAPPTNPADDAFFDAFEVATNQNRAPSPPIIDLRGVEKKLEQKKKQQSQQESAAETADSADDDFFSRFERAPQTSLGRTSPLVLEPEQIESMHDARTSPLPTTSSTSKGTESYFGLSAHPKPIVSNPGNSDQHKDAVSGSLSPSSPSSWTGSLRKTWTTLRGIQNEIANHLPSTSDFILPPDETEESVPSAAADGGHPNPGSSMLMASDASTAKGDTGDQSDSNRRRSGSSNRRGSGTLPHASDYSQNTPFSSSSNASSSGFSAGAAAPSTGSSASAGGAPLRARDLFASSSMGTLSAGGPNSASMISSSHLRRGPVHSSTAPISGAPGFDASSTRKWNTGDWKLDDKEKRAVPVTLSNRREETEAVIESFHASRIQALLPPRLQLGKRWSLLYSLDQHGISLQTLYHRVATGLDPTKLGRSVSGNQSGGAGADDSAAEGWLRGASRETQEAMRTRVQAGGRRLHVGGGLSSISDAGLVIAIKDENDNVFGAFVNEKLRPQQHYYGSGECFLWKTTHGANSEEKGEGSVEKYKWTGKNDYMVLSESTFLSVGGGEGKFGLWIDGALENGISSCCPAFDNEVLCDANERGQGQREGEKRFTCYGLEVWAVGID